MVFIDQHTHEFGHRDGRVGIVKLDDVFLVKVLQTIAGTEVNAKHVL